MSASKLVANAGRPANLTNAGKGRPAGVPNKATASIKSAFLEAFEKRGGVPALLAWAATEPTEFYKLAARLIPTEVSADVRVSTLEALVSASRK